MSRLEVRLRLRRAAFALDADLDVEARGVLGVFGPSGSGKTTLLRCLAGLERSAAGRVRLGDAVWLDSEAGVFVPAHRRGVGYVFQEPELFPHLTVEGNLRYAERRAKGGGVTFAEAVAWLGVEPLLGRLPGGLSGGERQRAAVARALLTSPRLLLLDEPLSALDEPGRREILPFLEALPARLSIPVLYVSHALEEVARLANRLVWLDGGGVRAQGATAELVARLDFARWRGERAAAVADAVVQRHDRDYELTLLASPWGPVWIRRQERAPGETVRIWISASDVSLGTGPGTASSVLNHFRVTVIEVEEAEAGQVLVRLVPPGSHGPALLARITRLSRDRLGVAPGVTVHAGVKSVAVVG